jgi:hypothetical protein
MRSIYDITERGAIVNKSKKEPQAKAGLGHAAMYTRCCLQLIFPVGAVL